MCTSLENLFQLCDSENERRNKEMLEHNPFDSVILENEFKSAYEKWEEIYPKNTYNSNFSESRKYDLSYEEHAVLWMYTGHTIFDIVNSNLLNSSLCVCKDIDEYKNLLNIVLNKLPSYNDQTVYRSECRRNLSFYKEIGVGSSFKESRFSSSHKSESIWHDDLSECLQLIIKTRSIDSFAKDITELSFVKEEEEVLFMSNATFEIEEIKEVDNTVVISEI